MTGTTVAVIQARMGSTRLPAKVLRPLGEHLVIDWVVRAARCATAVDEVVAPLFAEFEPTWLLISAGFDNLPGLSDELLDAKKEILKLRAELRRTQEERDILKKAVSIFSNPNE